VFVSTNSATVQIFVEEESIQFLLYNEKHMKNV